MYKILRKQADDQIWSKSAKKQEEAQVEVLFTTCIPWAAAMGVKDLTQLAQATDEPTETLEAFDGMTFGIDISQLAHKVLCGKAGADQYHGKPPVPIKALKDRIDDEVAKFEAYNIKLVAYFDGVDHPRKFVRKNREKEAATAQRQEVLEGRAHRRLE